MVESCSGTLIAKTKFFVLSGSESLRTISFDSFMSLVNSVKGHVVRRLFSKPNDATIGVKVETFDHSGMSYELKSWSFVPIQGHR